VDDLRESAFREWTAGRNDLQARISIYERIRDIPYAGIPELVDPLRYVEILRVGKGSCSPKHLLLCDMYERLGVQVLYVVYPFRWDEVEVDYPPRLRKLAGNLETSYHLACMVELDGQLRLVDATLDPPLKRLGLPVNEKWDGVNDTLLAITPRGEGEIYHPSEASLLTAPRDDNSLAFYAELNFWLDAVRRG